ncbi:MAG: peptidylprolyl isomerase [Roseimicrobium sp.]
MALIVNGEHIDDDLIEGEFRTIKSHYERMLQVACCERDPEFLAMAKDNLASRFLLQQAAKERVPSVTEESISEHLAMLVTQAGGEEQFYARIGMAEVDEAVVRSQVANGVRMDSMMQTVYAPEPEPSEPEVLAFYEAHQNEYLTEEEIRASHISMNLSGAKSRVEVYNTIRALREQALAGADFDQLAAEHNTSKDTSPDLGWFKRGEFMEEFEAIAFSMRQDEISPVFTTQLGFHICKLTDRKPAVPKPFEEVKDAVRQRIIEQHRDAKFNDFVEQLKTVADIQDTDPDEAGCGCGTSH